MRADAAAQMGLPHFPFVSGEIETLFVVLSQALDLARERPCAKVSSVPRDLKDN